MASDKTPILVKNDPWLAPYEQEIIQRQMRLENRKKELTAKYGSLEQFALGYEFLGFNYDKKKKGWWYREWAPKASSLSLVGDFNGWDRAANPMDKNEDGIWEIFLDDENYQDRLVHESAVKVHVVNNGKGLDRIPAYARYVTQDTQTYDFTARLWNPPKPFKWTDAKFDPSEAYENLYVYECHVGMAQEKEGLGTYTEFAEKILPKIKEQGYNAIQLMAVQEHPYYGSFGYHVSNFFAPSSRFGTPHELKALIDEAHKLGLAVIIDLVHSHAVKNISEGLNEFDGTDDQYFHPGSRGFHTLWDSKLFNYGKEEVLRFLLSNVRYWMEEFHVDGFRYDGVTSMLYFHHGDISFDHYDKYFRDVDWDVVTYFQLANTLIKKIKPESIVVAEDMSGMPGLCRPVEEGGLGFDFRLGMGIPDYWIKLLKHKTDEEWDIHEMWGTLTNRRYAERTIAYAESHDQALVGDKSIAFWLMDQEMYTHMHKEYDSVVIDRGIALHKMIRLLTLSLGGEGWLNFIGNEFGHPEWVDFPREGNNWSYKYARRQWNLQEHPDLKYSYLYKFGEAMVNFARKEKLVQSLPAQQLNMDENNKTIIFERNNLIFAFNFSPYNSIPDYRFKVPGGCGKYQIVLNSDKAVYGGHDRIDDEMTYPTVALFGEHFLSVYLPSRVALVLKKVES